MQQRTNKRAATTNDVDGSMYTIVPFIDWNIMRSSSESFGKTLYISFFMLFKC